MGTVRLLRGFSWPVRLLVVNQFGVNFGFYLLVPYLAGYLSDGVGLPLTVVAVVLAARNLSQQGLFLIGGSAADRLGARPVIIAGCALRTVGFGLFAVATGLPLLLAAAVLSGLAGALFNPAARAYLAQAAGDRRVEAFAVFQVFANAGALVGPLLGSVLLLVDFRLVALVAAVVFAGLTLAQAAVLPPRPPSRTGGTVLGDWWQCLADRRFLAFTLALAGMFALQNQLYLVLPMQAERVSGLPVSVAALFAVTTVATVLWQVRITGWCRRRWRPARAITAGLALMGTGFLLPPVGEALLGDPDSAIARALAFGPVLAASLTLALGLMIAHPFVLDHVGASGQDGLSGTYFGLFYVVSGVVAAAGTAVVGWAAERGAGVAIGLPAWLVCAGLGFGSAVAVWLLDHAGRLHAPASSSKSVVTKGH